MFLEIGEEVPEIDAGESHCGHRHLGSGIDARTHTDRFKGDRSICPLPWRCNEARR